MKKFKFQPKRLIAIALVAFLLVGTPNTNVYAAYKGNTIGNDGEVESTVSAEIYFTHFTACRSWR